MTFIIAIGVGLTVIAWLVMYSTLHKKTPSKPRLGTPEHREKMRDFLDRPTVRRQINGMRRLYKTQVIQALWEGRRPPHQVGDLMPMTKHRLQIEWNDEWQEVLDELGHYIDIDYNKLFDIPEEYPEAGIILTAEEIAASYVGEEKESELAN